MNQNDPMQVLYHVTKVMEDRGKKLDKIQSDVAELKDDLKGELNTIKIEVEVMKRAGILPMAPEEMKRAKLKDTAAGGSIGGILVAVIIGLWDFFSARFGG